MRVLTLATALLVLATSTVTVAQVAPDQALPTPGQSPSSGPSGGPSSGLSIFYVPDNKGMTRNLAGAPVPDGSVDKNALTCGLVSPSFGSQYNENHFLDHLADSRVYKLTGGWRLHTPSCPTGLGSFSIAVLSDDIVAQLRASRSVVLLEHISPSDLTRLESEFEAQPALFDTPHDAFIRSLDKANPEDLLFIRAAGSGACTDIDASAADKVSPQPTPFFRTTPDGAFEAMKSGKCSLFMGTVGSGRQLLAGLTRDSVDFDVEQRLISQNAVTQTTAKSVTDAASSMLEDWTSHMDQSLSVLADSRFSVLCDHDAECKSAQRALERAAHEKEKKEEAEAKSQLTANFSCNANGVPVEVFLCFAAAGGSEVGGGLKITNNGDTHEFTQSDLMQGFGGTEAHQALTAGTFSVEAQPNGSSNFILRVTVTNGDGKRIFSDESSEFRTISVSG